MPVAVAKLTWDDIKDRLENHLELVNGELVVSPVAGWIHQRICRLLGSLILPFVEAWKLGEFFPLPIHVVFGPGVEYEPDCCLIGAPAAMDETEQCYRGVPDLIIEVISESNRSHDTVVKFRDYERFGVKEYWLVDAREAHVRVFHLDADGKYQALGVFTPGEAVGTRILAGLALDPATLFAKR